jgi:hypothetical protein
MRQARTTRLPEHLRRLFWDYRFGSLSWDRDRDLVTQRLLAYGDLKVIRWLRQKLGDELLAEWLTQRRGAGLSPQQLHFLAAHLEAASSKGCFLAC